MSISDVSLSSPIEEKVAWAETCCLEFRGKLLKDKEIADYLIALKKAIYSSHKELAQAGIADVCMECEQSEGGSCCGAGLENRYNGWLLLINLLLEVKLPKKRYDAQSCFFLGANGCLLQARHVICINYICNRVTDCVDLQKLNALREKEGKEINILFLLHERIKKVLLS